MTDDRGVTGKATADYDVEENLTPEANIEYEPASPGVGESVTFDGSDSRDPDGEIASYEWEVVLPGNSDLRGVVSREQSFDLTFPEAERYQVVLTVTDDQSAMAASSTTISVTPAEQNLQIEGPSTVTPDTRETYEATPEDHSWVSHYKWTGDLGGEGPHPGREFTHSFDVPGEYYLTVTAYEKRQEVGGTVTETKRVTIDEGPVFESVSVLTRVDQGATATLEATVRDPDDAREDVTIKGVVQTERQTARGHGSRRERSLLERRRSP